MIERLGPGELEGLRALNALFAEVFGEPETYLGRPPDDAYGESILADPGVILLAAREEGRMVGGLAAYVLRKFEQARSEIYIYDLAVAADCRRRGIATALITELRRIARESGAWMTFVQGDYGDDPALALYGKLGTREEVLHFDIEP